MSIELLVPLDGSALADEAVAHAAEIARRVDGALHLVRVHAPLTGPVVPTEAGVLIPDPVLDEAMRAEAGEWLSRRALAVSRLNDVPVTYELRLGKPETEIVVAATERRARLIVCSGAGHDSAAATWLAGVVDSVMRHAACPVLTMSADGVKRNVVLSKLLVLLDGSEASGSILPHAAWLANAFGAAIDYLRLVPAPENPVEAIREYIARTNPDVVALATHGRGFLRLLVGGVADELVRQSDRPVLVFRPHELSWTAATRESPAVRTLEA